MKKDGRKINKGKLEDNGWDMRGIGGTDIAMKV